MYGRIDDLEYVFWQNNQLMIYENKPIQINAFNYKCINDKFVKHFINFGVNFAGNFHFHISNT